MIFIGGIGHGQKEIPYGQPAALCAICGGYGRYQVIMAYTYFSFFFIPLFKWNRRYYVKTTCCGSLYELDPEVGKALARGEQMEIRQEHLHLLQRSGQNFRGEYGYGGNTGSPYAGTAGTAGAGNSTNETGGSVISAQYPDPNGENGGEMPPAAFGGGVPDGTAPNETGVPGARDNVPTSPAAPASQGNAPVFPGAPDARALKAIYGENFRMRSCPSCGYQFIDQEKEFVFCPKCGNSLERKKQEEES